MSAYRVTRVHPHTYSANCNKLDYLSLNNRGGPQSWKESGLVVHMEVRFDRVFDNKDLQAHLHINKTVYSEASLQHPW